MNEFIDIYCERLEFTFWAEPVNAITNISFFIAAVFAARLAHKNGVLYGPSLILIALIATIGTGSFLFHTFATKWAMLSDSIPILFYQLAFLWLYGAHVWKLGTAKTGLFVGAFLVMTVLIYQLPHDWLNGSILYAPAIFFLSILAVVHYLKDFQERMVLALAAGAFILSLTFRSIDMQLCEAFPLGTHFMWHVLNGVVLYLTTRAYIRNI